MLEQGGLAPGGLNFDCKVRRESTALEDMFIAHIGKLTAHFKYALVNFTYIMGPTRGHGHTCTGATCCSKDLRGRSDYCCSQGNVYGCLTQWASKASVCSFVRGDKYENGELPETLISMSQTYCVVASNV